MLTSPSPFPSVLRGTSCPHPVSTPTCCCVLTVLRVREAPVALQLTTQRWAQPGTAAGAGGRVPLLCFIPPAVLCQPRSRYGEGGPAHQPLLSPGPAELSWNGTEATLALRTASPQQQQVQELGMGREGKSL